MTQFTVLGKIFQPIPETTPPQTPHQKHRKAPQYPATEAEYRGTLPSRALYRRLRKFSNYRIGIQKINMWL